MCVGAEALRQSVRIRVSRKQQGLITHHANVPHGRRAAEFGQRHFGEHRFHYEQKRTTQEQRHGEEEEQSGPPREHGKVSIPSTNTMGYF